MALHIAFEKEADSFIKTVVRTFAGPYVHTDMIVSQVSPTHVHTSYSSFMGEGFARIFQNEFWFSKDTHDFLFVDVTQDELQKISETCEACAESKIKYNTRDMVLCLMPLRRPREKTLFEAGPLFCSQAMILILRSCLNPKHPLQGILQAIHSRTTTPSQLHTALKTVCHATCKPIFLTQHAT
jgi:hypothetical protein